MDEKTKVIMLRLPEDSHQRIKRLAKIAGVSMNQWLRNRIDPALNPYLEKDYTKRTSHEETTSGED